MSAVSLEAAYAEACQALGEGVVMQRLQGKRITELEDALARATAEPMPAPTER